MLLVFLEAKFVSLSVGLLLVTSTEIQKMKNEKSSGAVEIIHNLGRVRAFKNDLQISLKCQKYQNKTNNNNNKKQLAKWNVAVNNFVASCRENVPQEQSLKS